MRKNKRKKKDKKWLKIAQMYYRMKYSGKAERLSQWTK